MIKMLFENEHGRVEVDVNDDSTELHYRSTVNNYNFKPPKKEDRDFVMELRDDHNWWIKEERSIDPQRGGEKLWLYHFGCEFREEAEALLSEEEMAENESVIPLDDFWRSVHNMFEEEVHYLKTIGKVLK